MDQSKQVCRAKQVLCQVVGRAWLRSYVGSRQADWQTVGQTYPGQQYLWIGKPARQTDRQAGRLTGRQVDGRQTAGRQSVNTVEGQVVSRDSSLFGYVVQKRGVVVVVAVVIIIVDARCGVMSTTTTLDVWADEVVDANES